MKLSSYSCSRSPPYPRVPIHSTTPNLKVATWPPATNPIHKVDRCEFYAPPLSPVLFSPNSWAQLNRHRVTVEIPTFSRWTPPLLTARPLTKSNSTQAIPASPPQHSLKVLRVSLTMSCPLLDTSPMSSPLPLSWWLLSSLLSGGHTSVSFVLRPSAYNWNLKDSCGVNRSDYHRVGKLHPCQTSTWFDHRCSPRRPQSKRCRRCPRTWCAGFVCDPQLQHFLGSCYSILGRIHRRLLPGPIQDDPLLLLGLFVSFNHLSAGSQEVDAILIRVGYVVLVGTSVPSSLAHPDGALAGLIVAIIIVGIGAGSIKANVSPMIAEQYTGKLRKKALPSGEVVIISPALTYQRVFMCKHPTPAFPSECVIHLNCRLLRRYQRRSLWCHLLAFHCP